MLLQKRNSLKNSQAIMSFDLVDFDDFKFTTGNKDYTIVTRFERNRPTMFKVAASRTLKKLFFEVSAPLKSFWIVFSMLHPGFKVVPTGNSNTNTIYLNVIPKK